MPWIPMRDGKSVYVRVVGKGSPVIFLHGFGMHSGHWLPFLLPLSHRYRFYLPDMRGFGRSAGVRHNSECVLTNYAEDLQDMIEHFHLSDFPMAGISMGAFIAMQYFRLAPDHRVRAYLNIDQSPFVHQASDWSYGMFGADGQARFKILGELYREAREYSPETPFESLPKYFQQAFLHELSDFIGYAVSRPTQKRLVKQLWKFPFVANYVLPAAHWHAYNTCLGAYLHQDYDMRPLLENLDIPVWVLAGMRSDMYPWPGQKFIADQCVRGHFIPFKDSGHMPMLDEPGKFIRVANAFIQKSIGML
ncbi:hypothetical protein BTA51_24700 [Hahella sp. CCB-MM4]|uniref:alpha/beta fold hydrolase n=1 Tax=Hahella sp. (strain CCB-MM4) TaxID=1926491 RepID=UPI000B9BB0E2|nr:alpha/beta hydrolase [Hahella sp. CCB-MM4]OZG70783.1 hypothetical protein BTA51_24700 [Hahella sp. CCB-MM4]